MSLQKARDILSAIDAELGKLDAATLARLIAGDRVVGYRVSEETPDPTPETRNPIPAVRNPAPSRWLDSAIEQLIPPSSSVLDLGCGDGALLDRLTRTRSIRGQGIELDAESVMACVRRGVAVFQSDLDRGLAGFADQSFDYVVLEETLQTLHRPMELLSEILRVGRRSLVAFPNFGHWRVRFELAYRGCMPVTDVLPFTWYNSPNIHHLSLRDFLDWTSDSGVKVLRGLGLIDGQVRELTYEARENLYVEEALFVIAR